MRFINGLIRYRPGRYLFAGCLCILFFPFSSFAQPANNDCVNASIVNISTSGFGLGTFTSSTFDLTSATVQPGETFAPAILVAGQNQKSIWYKFTLPTSRSVRITLAQTGSAITAGDAGFAVYKTNNCLPGNADISSKLTPIGLFGNSFHPCLEAGEYLVQVSGKTAANGPVYITVELARGNPTIYDLPTEAYVFGNLNLNQNTHIDFNVDCHSIDDSSEICLSSPTFKNFNKSTWHTFTTPNYFDWIAVAISGYNQLSGGGLVGYRIYKGDVKVMPVTSLIPVVTCDSLGFYNDRIDVKSFTCAQLSSNTTYTIQLLYPGNFVSGVRLAIPWGGKTPTRAPQPLNTIPAANQLGILPGNEAGITTNAAADYFGCNSKHNNYNCPKTLPPNGLIKYIGSTQFGVPRNFGYNLSNFYSFTIGSTSSVAINTTSSYRGDALLYLRLYKQNLSGSCADLDTTNIVAQNFESLSFECMTPGDYVLQVMGTDTGYDKNELIYNYISSYLVTGSSPLNIFRHLGTSIGLSISVTTQFAVNKYSLSAAGKYDAVNADGAGVMQPLNSHIKYNLQLDTMGCNNTVVPDITCDNSTKASYHEFVVADSGSLSFTSWSELPTKIYRGDANALVTAQGKYNYPEKFTGLLPVSNCIGGPHFVYTDFETSDQFCITPGTFTLVNMSALRSKFGNINTTRNLSVTLRTTKPKFDSPSKAEDMGDLWTKLGSGGGNYVSQRDTFTCYDNPATIDGLVPCKGYYGPGNKLVYRQFYLSKPTLIAIETSHMSRLFYGKATDGLAGLKLVSSIWNCFTSVGSDCLEIPAGWYTVVSYGVGHSFNNPTEPVNQGTSNLNGINGINIALKLPLCKGPSYNRPYKAAIDTITNQPFLLQWAPRVGHTAAYPITDTTYALYTETFGCANDTPFSSHPVVSCSPLSTKVAYWVFKITQESFVAINTENYWHGWTDLYAYSAMVYAGNARADSTLLGNTTPIQPCLRSLGHIQLCKLQPGTYTLVVFAPDDAVCRTITPKIYIDQVGYSRFDHANNAYDFGQIRPDSTWYNGKPGDVNPLNPGRAASNDFFYCTTGAQLTDPLYGCASVVLPNVYKPGNNVPLFTSNYISGDGYTYPLGVARNLWYTFTVDKGGLVKVRVSNKTIDKGWNYNYYVLKSNVDGTLPFSTVVASGGVDSAMAQGLELVANNSGSYCDANQEVSFFRETCTPIPERYYIVVSNRVPSNSNNHNFFNPEWMYPNHQVEVSVLFDSANAVLPKFDHYSQANNLGTNLGPGIFRGATDNYSCATRDATDPMPSGGNCNKNLWYKFSTTVSGNIKFRMFNLSGGYYEVGSSRFQLFRQIIPGDSTINGLQFIPGVGLNDGSGPNGYYSTECISPGTYYIILPNCDATGGEVYPEITITENAGDFCSRPVIAALNGAGSSVSSVLVDCHTIGTDYGEFNPTLTCPAGAVTNQYKSSWFKINITGTDTLDVTTFLSENTNASSSQIKYRLMNGDCGAMQERSCVQDALTQDTYKCLAPGDYWVQVFTPTFVGNDQVTGTIDLHLNAVKHVDTCAPINPCLSNANFQMQFDCTANEAVRFINYSTYGSSVSYNWNFGYNGQNSAAVSPKFVYPSLATSQKYYITLTVTNNSCGGFSTYRDSIEIPARPVVNLGADTSLCDGGSVLLNATSFSGSTYQWNTGATTSTITAALSRQNNYFVTVTYNGCIARDTISVNIDPISPQKLNKYTCGTDPVVLNASRGLGESYAWNTGLTAASINVYTPGTYWVDINLKGCITRDTMIVSATANSLGNDRSVCFGAQPVILNATAAGAVGYTWQNGSIAATFAAPAAGLYWVDISFGNCTLRDSILLSNIQPTFNNLSSTVCQGQLYTLPSGIKVSAAGIYSDTARTAQGCDSSINTVNLIIKPVSYINLSATICQGQSYTLPGGTVVNTTAVYRDTVRYTNSSCDSIRREVVLTVQPAFTTTTNVAICGGQTYMLPWGIPVNTPGVYSDTVRYSISGCDSLYRTVTLFVQPVQIQPATSATICAGQTYTLPWGNVVNISGIYGDTLRYTNSGCDSVIRVVNLTVQSPTTAITNEAICSGGSFILPWGMVVNSSGTYRDTLRFINTACDSLYRIIHITTGQAPSSVMNVIVCEGQSYILPWGATVNNPGTFKDTMQYTVSGCDSVYLTVHVTYQPVQKLPVINANICGSQSYQLPWGIAVNTSGIYRDTLRYLFSGCDSLIRTVNLTVQPLLSSNTNATICAAQSYTLPWGPIVSTSGIFKDTLRYIAGCDSLYQTVNLIVLPVTSSTINPIICSGQTYALPWGPVVNFSGIYRDTLRYKISGCDSVRRTVNLTVQSTISSAINAFICSGQTYTLPWGTIVGIAGVYRDTLRYPSGCDSLRRTINLAVKGVTVSSGNVDICSGKNYTLPWGGVVNTSGVYSDTIRYITGCDSLVRIIRLTIQNPPALITNATICEGQTYTLPSGTIVAVSGTYTDTLYSVSGCDSVWKTVNLTVQKSLALTTNASICAGQNYTLPWGIVVSTAGIYRDTMRYSTGCDSVRRTIILTVQLPISSSNNAIICEGQNYTLPWGTVVSSGGVYRDTIHYLTGCDSLSRTVNLTVQKPVLSTTNAIICQGQLYTLPWGTIINRSGIYRDTLKYVSGCDSVRRLVNLIVQTVSAATTNAIICDGEQYTLPWGTIVSTSGIYRDTLHYGSGCDSVRRTINLVVQKAFTSSFNVTICAGKNYVLPSGTILNKTGIYMDTLRYLTGCDSLRVRVNLVVTAPATINTTKSICSDETYTLPWGTVVNLAGNYRDTIRTIGGCDSLIRTVELTVKPRPVISVTKSNDVNCIIGRVMLNVYGADKYVWAPASSLDNAFVNNPIATPTQTTRYVVTATAINGCIAKDSIEVKLLAIDPQKTYLVPTSFTPNNDGLNDCFGVPYWGNVTDFNFTVYDRYGKLMFQTTNPTNCWDGRYSGTNQNSGAYVYFITARGICGPVNRKGTVMLVR